MMIMARTTTISSSSSSNHHYYDHYYNIIHSSSFLRIFKEFMLLSLLLSLLMINNNNNMVKGFYFHHPGIIRRRSYYQEGDIINLKVNKLTSNKTLLPMDYYKLPFCQNPTSGAIMSHHQNLGQYITGDRIYSSPYKLKFKHNVYCQQLCITHLGRSEESSSVNNKNKFIKSIHNDYHHNWIIDNLDSSYHIIMMQKQQKQDDEDNDNNNTITNTIQQQQYYYYYGQGFPIGFIDNNKKSYVYNHVNIEIQYRRTTSDENNKNKNNNNNNNNNTARYYYEIVGFSIQPFSIGYDFEFIDYYSNNNNGLIANITNPIIESCNNNNNNNNNKIHNIKNSIPPIEPQQVASGKVLFTYDVIWKENNDDNTKKWENRWDVYYSKSNNNMLPAEEGGRAAVKKSNNFIIMNGIVMITILLCVIIGQLIIDINTSSSSSSSSSSQQQDQQQDSKQEAIADDEEHQNQDDDDNAAGVEHNNKSADNNIHESESLVSNNEEEQITTTETKMTKKDDNNNVVDNDDDDGILIFQNVFRPPLHSSVYFTSFMGTGIQLLCTALIVLILASMGYLNAPYRGALIMSVIYSYCGSGFVGGYVSGHIHKQFRGGEKLLPISQLTIKGLPGIWFVLSFVVRNILCWLHRSTYVLPLSKMIVLLSIGTMLFVLVVIGAIFAYHGKFEISKIMELLLMIPTPATRLSLLPNHTFPIGGILLWITGIIIGPYDFLIQYILTSFLAIVFITVPSLSLLGCTIFLASKTGVGSIFDPSTKIKSFNVVVVARPPSNTTTTAAGTWLMQIPFILGTLAHLMIIYIADWTWLRLFAFQAGTALFYMSSPYVYTGVLPYSIMYPLYYNIFRAYWGLQYFDPSGPALGITFLVYLSCVGLVSILHTYVSFVGIVGGGGGGGGEKDGPYEGRRFRWWHSFCAAGSNALYFFFQPGPIFGTVFESNNINSFTTSFVYVGSMLIITLCIFLLSGAFGTCCSVWFVRKVFYIQSREVIIEKAEDADFNYRHLSDEKGDDLGVGGGGNELVNVEER